MGCGAPSWFISFPLGYGAPIPFNNRCDGEAHACVSLSHQGRGLVTNPKVWCAFYQVRGRRVNQYAEGDSLCSVLSAKGCMMAQSVAPQFAFSPGAGQYGGPDCRR